MIPLDPTRRTCGFCGKGFRKDDLAAHVANCFVHAIEPCVQVERGTWHIIRWNPHGIAHENPPLIPPRLELSGSEATSWAARIAEYIDLDTDGIYPLPRSLVLKIAAAQL